MKTILFPITLFAVYAAPSTSPTRFLHCLSWTWLHLLQFCVSNQYLSPGEDARNKPWRPIPSGRITVPRATILRWALLPICLFISAFYDVLIPSAIFALGVLVHNECKMDSHWLSRNILNAIGYATFDTAATFIAQADRSQPLQDVAVTAHHLSTLIVFSTIHAQDFKDEPGDRYEGRRTIPIVMPRIARVTMPIILLLWSIILNLLPGSFHLSVTSVALLGLGLLVGLRFALLSTPKADRMSYLLYNLWLALARITPFYWRI
ncbi:hypothetical protein HYDPIDRAFT_110338 [Hydnomerulius pinastri MD-312]|nr:hypothetical protein HYDPIDRAFT_110338 [Hydnomerulius pinastri MD-312]